MQKTRLFGALRAGFLLLATGAAAMAPSDAQASKPLTAYTLASRFPGGEGAVGLGAWRRLAARVRDVSVPSTADGREQRALFFDSGTAQPKPLLVVLHSWSTDWRQNIGIPYAVFAEQNDWAFIHPDFRGPYRRPEAAASDLAAQDIVDAVEWAKRHAAVDESRIYLAGFSGGGMTALAMAARRPDIWAGVAAWAPIHDVPDWYAYNVARFPRRHYARNIEAVCDGAPLDGTRAQQRCRDRSPSALLERARSAGVPVYVASGVSDDIVPVEHSVRAFNQLADAAHRLPEADLRRLLATPQDLPTASVDAFARASAPLRLLRTSASATLALFEGGHDVVYEASLAWLREQRRKQAPATSP